MSDDSKYAEQAARAKARQEATIASASDPEATRHTLPRGSINIAAAIAKVDAFILGKAQTPTQSPRVGSDTAP